MIYVMCIPVNSTIVYYCILIQIFNKQEVLEESTSATTRARQNAEEQAKLEERKMNIQKALLLRLIVDEVDEKKGEEENVEKNEEVKKSVCHTNCECEKCQYWKWESPTPAESGDSAAAAASSSVAVKSEQKDEVGEVSPAIRRGIVTIEEEGSDDEDLLASIAKADATMKGDIDIEAQMMDDNSPPSPPLSPRSSPQGSPEITTQPSPLSSPSRLSLSSPRKYTDALNCGSSRSGRSYTDALNCGGNAVRSAGCGNSTNKLSCSIHSSRNNITPNTGIGTDGNDTPTISLLEIVSLYGEECNICLSHFQVGDRVGTNRHHDERSSFSDSDEMTNSESEVAGSRCTHAFHEECISRWLLVRDGCPICRRSYFETESTAASTESTGDNVDLESGTVSSNSNLGTIVE